MADVSLLLEAAARGDRKADADLLPLVYDELRKLAANRLANESPGQTVQPTALVHEAYLRLIGPNVEWDGRGHFFASAAEAMRRILVDAARRKNVEKHGGGMQRHDVVELPIVAPESSEDLVALDKALTRLSEHDAVKADLVKLRYFVG